VARASLEELLIDYKDYLRCNNLPLWEKEHPHAQKIRKMAYLENRFYLTYRSYVEIAPAQVAANTVICLIHQANYLLDQLLRQLEKSFLENGGFTERLYNTRQNYKRNNRY
jgi:restriction system protein